MTTKATQMLEEEHRVIQKVAASLATVGEDLEMGKSVQSKVLQELAKFLETFVEQCHQRKEETYLFAILEKKGVPASGCPLAVLNNEHAKERALIKQFAEAVEVYVRSQGTVRKSLAATIRALVELLPGHIWKEDYLLLPMADKVLSPGEQETLRTQFEQVDSGIGPGVHQGFERLAAGLEQAVHQS